MTRRARWIVPVTVLVVTGWLVSLSVAEPRRARERDRERAERREREERRDRQEDEERERREFVRELEQQERETHEVALHLKTLETMRDMTFEPELAALIAIGAIRDDLDLEPKAAAKHLEGILKKTKSLGLRNAIRMALRECYDEADEQEKILSLLKDTIAENDEALLEEEDDDDDEDDEDDR